jgi:hypothetical protein
MTGLGAAALNDSVNPLGLGVFRCRVLEALAGTDGLGDRDELAGLAQPAGRHVGVDGLVFATAN